MTNTYTAKPTEAIDYIFNKKFRLFRIFESSIQQLQNTDTLQIIPSTK